MENTPLESPDVISYEFYEMVYFPTKHSCLCNKKYYGTELIDMITFSEALSILHQRNLKRRLHSENAPNVRFMYRVCQSFLFSCFRPLAAASLRKPKKPSGTQGTVKAPMFYFCCGRAWMFKTLLRYQAVKNS